MGAFLKLTGTATLTIAIQLIGSGDVLASVATSHSGVSAITNLKQHYSVEVVDTSKTETHLKDSGYQPPPDIGGPGRSQGSGTR